RLALGHDPSPVPKLPSFLDLAEKSVSGGPQRQHRWWFVGHFDAIRHTADAQAFEFEGSGLKVDTAPTQLKAAQGRGAKPTRAAREFAELATRNMPALSEEIPAFAELEDLVSLALAAEIVRRQAGAEAEGPRGRDREAGESQGETAATESSGPWRPTQFLDEEVCPIARLETPKQTPSLANARFVKD